MTARQQNIPPQFGKRIRRERERRGWSLREMADKCGATASTIMRTERGNDPALSSAIAIAEVLGLSLGALLAESSCETCDGVPPPGFICAACGATGSDAP